jgi:O-acetyl-ADP-ribose deacetylase (regulator of RNase III)
MIELYQGDITKLAVDAIVNAANTTLLGGGGVDGAIHRTAGPELLAECKRMNGCDTGDAKITHAYLLPAKYVIHTVGPVWKGGNKNEDACLKSCYLNSLELAFENGVKTIAFPNISTGVYHFPKARAAKIAIETVKDYMGKHALPKKVIFTCFDEENYNLYSNILNNQDNY